MLAEVWARSGEPQRSVALLRQRIDPELVTGMRADDRSGEFAREGARTARMIDVRVRDDDGFDLQSMLVEHSLNVRQIVAGIDHDRFLGYFITEDRAIALQHSNRQYLVNHNPIFPSPRATL